MVRPPVGSAVFFLVLKKPPKLGGFEKKNN